MTSSVRRTPRGGTGSLTLLALVLSFTACGDDEDPAGARRLWGEIHDLRYRQWERAPGYEERRVSHAPHGGSVDIYVNDVMAEALSSGEPLTAWPRGAIVVKDGFDGSALELVAAMEKQDRGWFWAEWDAGGDADYSGTPELCVDCHRSGADGVRAFALPGASGQPAQ